MPATKLFRDLPIRYSRPAPRATTNPAESVDTANLEH